MCAYVCQTWSISFMFANQIRLCRLIRGCGTHMNHMAHTCAIRGCASSVWRHTHEHGTHMNHMAHTCYFCMTAQTNQTAQTNLIRVSVSCVCRLIRGCALSTWRIYTSLYIQRCVYTLYKKQYTHESNGTLMNQMLGLENLVHGCAIWFVGVPSGSWVCYFCMA